MNKKMIILNSDKCSGCRTCTIICLEKFYNIDEMGISRREIVRYEDEENNRIKFYSLACFHCIDSPCIENCPTKALQRDEETNMVIVKDELCIGCEACAKSCKYNIPKFENKKMIKCDGCIDRIKLQQEPLCVQTCPMKALKVIDYNVDEYNKNIKAYENMEKI